MDFRDYFLRVQDCDGFDKRPYKRKICSGYGKEKDNNLFNDCFSNHTDCYKPSTNKIVIDEASDSRHIKRDILSSYFINTIYSPPQIIDYNTEKDVDYKKFIKLFAEESFSFEESSDDARFNDRFTLGGNRIRYIVGDVGVGKSAFIRKIQADLDRDDAIDEKYTLISIYFDLEKTFNYSHIPAPLNNEFNVQLVKLIKD
ncbi:MAG: hypothetical protein OQK59_01075, partial [Chlorobium sp.]|nr:hypothetical protein [Chlorobium sp.]